MSNRTNNPGRSGGSSAQRRETGRTFTAGELQETLQEIVRSQAQLTQIIAAQVQQRQRAVESTHKDGDHVVSKDLSRLVDSVCPAGLRERDHWLSQLQTKFAGTQSGVRWVEDGQVQLLSCTADQNFFANGGQGNTRRSFMVDTLVKYSKAFSPLGRRELVNLTDTNGVLCSVQPPQRILDAIGESVYSWVKPHVPLALKHLYDTIDVDDGYALLNNIRTKTDLSVEYIDTLHARLEALKCHDLKDYAR